MRNRHPLVVSLCLVASAGCNAIMAPSPIDDNWRTRTLGHFTFYVRPNSFAEANLTTLAEVLDDQFSTSVTRLNLRYQGHITMFLYDNGKDAGFGDDYGGGNYSGVAYPETETVKSVCVPPLSGNLFALLSHEMNHVIIRNGLGRPGTTFVNEGLASAILSERFHALGPTHYYKWAADRRSQLPPLSALIDDERWKTYPSPTSYAASASFLAFVIEVYGATPLKGIYYASSSEFESAFRIAFGKSLSEVEAEWRTFVAR